MQLRGAACSVCLQNRRSHETSSRSGRIDRDVCPYRHNDQMTSSVCFDRDFLRVCCFSLLSPFSSFFFFFSGLPRHDPRNVFIEEVRAVKANREKTSISNNRARFQMRDIRNSLRVLYSVVERTTTPPYLTGTPNWFDDV